ncbi:ATP-binding protein [Streptomyces sp. NPDC046275]|uniref:ATP-binding protein n=1 Tax=Streptomyces sp. NPDC046275 TaxID=3157201 RepID=UPI0033E31220
MTEHTAEAGWWYDGGVGTVTVARDATAAFLRRATRPDVHPDTPSGLGPGADPAPDRGTVVDVDTDTALLVVSELVTNAVKHAPGPLRLELALREGTLEISVCDGSTAGPVLRAPDPERIGGHGMEIVAALCRYVVTEPTAHGKRVTAVLGVTRRPELDTRAPAKRG